LETESDAGGWRPRGAAHRQPRTGLHVLLVGVAVVAAGALFMALVAVAVLDGLLQAGAACDSTAGVSLPLGEGAVVAATVYAGTGTGAYGVELAGHYAFAELGLWSEGDTDRGHADRIGVALGLGHALAPFSQLEVRAPNGRSVVAEKLDVGMGGPPIEGHQRAIDLWTSTREALALPPDWSGLVRVEPAPSAVIGAEAYGGQGVADSSEGLAPGCARGAAPSSGTGQRIVEIARSQLGTGEDPPGSNCTVYGPCEPWCALFTTWVWRKAGIDIPTLGFSGAIYEWAVRHAHVYPPATTPQPGWAALFGSGPADPSTSLHVAIVESVLPRGQITLINGNFADAVMRTGPCQPARAELAGVGGCEEPAPIYGYAAPE
jgi:CHAP domain